MKAHLAAAFLFASTMALPVAVMAQTAQGPVLTKTESTPEIDAALSQGGSLVTVKVSGMVCDFCAVSLKKTFGKRPEVAASHVDLDTKQLLLVLKPDTTLDDATISQTVIKSGYLTESIQREID
jgi:copper chaperone CopZ